jgi:hypothetical protein
MIEEQDLVKRDEGTTDGNLGFAAAAAAEPTTAKSPLQNKSKENNSQITLPLSQSLHRKLKIKAQQEGVSIEDFVSELLAEGLVLRAWEIMERKNAMRGGQAANNPAFPNRGANNNRNFRNPGPNANFNRTRQASGNSVNVHNGGGSQMNNAAHNRRAAYNNIFEDSANFLEYVRSQEKKQR